MKSRNVSAFPSQLTATPPVTLQAKRRPYIFKPFKEEERLYKTNLAAESDSSSDSSDEDHHTGDEPVRVWYDLTMIDISI